MTILPPDHRFAHELGVAIPLVRNVASEVDRIYRAGSAIGWDKADGSPVTEADMLADRLLREHLSAAFPHDALLTEESEDTPDRLQNRRCWIADPVDGTAQFVARTGNFDVMLALVVDHEVQLAVCGHPPSGTLVVAVHGAGTWTVTPAGTARQVRFAPSAQPPVLSTSIYYAPDEHVQELAQVAAALDTAPPEVRSCGFSPRSLLPGWRNYDAFVGFWKRSGNSPVREWDLAACDLITTEGGGVFTDLFGERYRYNQPSPRPRTGLLVVADPRLHERLVDALAPVLPARHRSGTAPTP